MVRGCGSQRIRGEVELGAFTAPSSQSHFPSYSLSHKLESIHKPLLISLRARAYVNTRADPP